MLVQIVGNGRAWTRFSAHHQIIVVNRLQTIQNLVVVSHVVLKVFLPVFLQIFLSTHLQLPFQSKQFRVVFIIFFVGQAHVQVVVRNVQLRQLTHIIVHLRVVLLVFFLVIIILIALALMFDRYFFVLFIFLVFLLTTLVEQWWVRVVEDLL